MTMQMNTALSALKDGGKARGTGEQLEHRLSDVQGFLATDLEQVEEALREVAALGPNPAPQAALHLVERGGKRVRPLALLLANRCFSSHLEQATYEMASVVELVHSATLLHDDVIDEGTLRRGAPTSRCLYGNGVSVLSGDLLLVQSLDRTARHAPDLLGELITTLRKLVEGEIVQLRGRTELDASEQTYYQILELKTASLFSFATQAGARLAGAPVRARESLASFGHHLGLAFQLVDDVLDYSGQRNEKNLYADLLEGKMTLPLVLALKEDPHLLPLIEKIHGGDRAAVTEVSSRVLGTSACETVRARAQLCTAQALSALSELPPSSARDFLRVVAEEMTGRGV